MAFKIDLYRNGTGGQIVFNEQDLKPVRVSVDSSSKDLPKQPPIPVNTPPDKKDN